MVVGGCFTLQPQALCISGTALLPATGTVYMYLRHGSASSHRHCVHVSQARLCFQRQALCTCISGTVYLRHGSVSSHRHCVHVSQARLCFQPQALCTCISGTALLPATGTVYMYLRHGSVSSHRHCVSQARLCLGNLYVPATGTVYFRHGSV